LARDRERTEDHLTVWPHQEIYNKSASSPIGTCATSYESHSITRAQKEAIRRQGLLNADGDLATPYRRLKLVMDYWCALWFWPITQSATLPSREAWWLEVGAILEGNIIDVSPQQTLDLQDTPAAAPPVGAPQGANSRLPPLLQTHQPSFDGFDQPQRPLTSPPPPLGQSWGGGLPAAEAPQLHDKLGQLRISKLRTHFARIPQVEAVAEARRFLHWELCFADILLLRGGFDLLLGNPPWLRPAFWANTTRCLPSTKSAPVT